MYTFLAYNFMQFPFQLLVSEAVFLIGVSKRHRFAPRLFLGLVLQFTLGYVWQTVIGYVSGISLLPYVFLYFGYALFSMLPIILGFDVSGLELIFILAGGYATQHMIFAFSKIVLFASHHPYDLNGSMLHLFGTRYIIFIFGAVLIYFLVVKNKSGKDGFHEGDVRIAVLAVIVLVFAIGFSVYWSYDENIAEMLIGEVICPAYSFMCCTLVLFMEYYVLRENSMKHEKELMEQLLQMANAQQKSSKEAIDIINIKCHDLKHQIKALADMEDVQTRFQYLKEIQDAVSIYDATYHTGCKALDYILREKTLLFEERQVEFSCMVEGAVINFMESADIYAVMGNALENALEQVQKEQEGERIISLQIKHRNEMVLIHLENRCSRNIQFEGGLPVTSKEDKNQHGFGVRSIQYIVKKYQGDLMMAVKDGKFCLDILLPIQ